jgi:hypothetical protein
LCRGCWGAHGVAAACTHACMQPPMPDHPVMLLGCAVSWLLPQTATLLMCLPTALRAAPCRPAGAPQWVSPTARGRPCCRRGCCG